MVFDFGLNPKPFPDVDFSTLASSSNTKDVDVRSIGVGGQHDSAKIQKNIWLWRRNFRYA